MEEQGIVIAGPLSKLARAQLKAEKEKERLEYIDHVEKASPAAKVVIKYWLLRTRFLRNLRNQVASYIRS